MALCSRCSFPQKLQEQRLNFPVIAQAIQIRGELLAIKRNLLGRGRHALLRRGPGLSPGGEHRLTVRCGRWAFADNVLHGGLVDLITFDTAHLNERFL